MGKEGIILQSAGPINDGGRKYNVIYYISVIVCAVIAVVAFGFNTGIFVTAVIFGLLTGLLIKSSIIRFAEVSLREMSFYAGRKIPYPELINGLVPVLTQIGATVEKNTDGSPVITYKGIIYDVSYNDDNTFGIWWRKSLLSAFLLNDKIRAYRKKVIAMGIIGYNVQQICSAGEEKTM